MTCTNNTTCKCAFQWPSGLPVNYTASYSGNPNAATTACVRLNYGVWVVSSCTVNYVSVCEGMHGYAHAYR
jgi:hypothetical protein